MKYLFFIFGIFGILFSCTSCDPIGLDRCKRDYLFSIPASLELAKDTFFINDTIHLSLNFSDHVHDLNTNEKYQLIDFPFNAELNVVKIDTTPFKSVVNEFDFFVEKGELTRVTLTGGYVTNLIQFDYFDNMYDFKIKMVLHEPGLYSLAFNYTKPNHSNFSINLDMSCKEDYDLAFQTNNATDNNFALLQFSPDPQIQAYDKDEYLKKYGSFAFFVIE